MKKKTYTIPDMEVFEIQTMTLLAGSGVSSDEFDLDFGGVDEGGALDPAAHELNDFDFDFNCY